jgi:8-oxo-dGTP pyrophosphatase MutT (NUDIX family)
MKQDDNPWETLDSKVVYQNPWMKVYEDKVRMPGGAEGIYGFVEGKPGIFIIAMDEDDKVYLVESFRYPTQKWQWELPTGGIDVGMSPLDAAKNELAEELGMTAEQWTHVNTYAPTHNGLMKDTQYVFVAKGLHSGTEQHEEFEAIRAVKAVSFKEILAMIAAGKLADGQSLAALMQFFACYGFKPLR